MIKLMCPWKNDKTSSCFELSFRLQIKHVRCTLGTFRSVYLIFFYAPSNNTCMTNLAFNK